MVCNVMSKICLLGLLVVSFATTYTLRDLDVRSLFFGKTSLVEKVWTPEDLGTLARSQTMSIAVARLTGATLESRAPRLDVEGIKGRIDAAAEEGIRTALLKVAAREGGRKKDPLAAFARTDRAAATCGPSGSAGGDGLDLCVERCERKPSMTAISSPARGACHALCSLAIAPCEKGLVSWEGLMTVLTKVETMPSECHRMAVKVETTARLAHTKVSTALADLSSWVSAVLDYLGASTTLKVMYVLVLLRDLWIFVRDLQKRLKAAQDETKRLKLKQLFKIRGRLLKQEGWYALQNAGAQAMHRESVEAEKAEREKASCRLLGGLVSGRSKRAMATSFARWQGAAAVDAASSEADANDGEDKTAG